MTLVAIPSGLWWPWRARADVSTTNTIDLTGEKIAVMGRVYIAGRAASKTISGAGGGSIGFLAGTTTWSDGSSTMSIGIQDVATGSGPGPQPDGSFDVHGALTGGAGLTGSAWNTIDMTNGTKTISHGDLIAVVFDFTNRAGSDSLVVAHSDGFTANGGRDTGSLPGINTHNATSWGTSVEGNCAPNIGITFDDGTLGIIDGCWPLASNVDEAYSDSTNPDERGVLFQVPFDCKIDALWTLLGHNGGGANSDFTLALYSDPLGTPNALVSHNGLGEQMGGGFFDRGYSVLLASEISLTKNTDYVIALKGTGSGTVRRPGHSLPAAGWRAFIPGGTTLAKVTRDGGSGAFSSSSTSIVYNMGVRISQVHDSAGSGGGGARVIGG